MNLPKNFHMNMILLIYSQNVNGTATVAAAQIKVLPPSADHAENIRVEKTGYHR